MTDTDDYQPLSDREKENKDLRSRQIAAINKTLKKVRTISKKSQQFAQDTFGDTPKKKSRADLPPAQVGQLDPLAGVYVGSPGRVDNTSGRCDDTSSFVIQDTQSGEDLASVLTRALSAVNDERRTAGSKGNSKVIHRWRIV